MVGPVNGASAQQVAIANPFQQQQQQTDVREREPEENRTQPAGTAAAEAQGSETNNQNNTQLTAASNQKSQDTSQSGGRERGSLVDISV